MPRSRRDAHEQLTGRLNRGVRSRSAQVRFVKEQPFGDQLTLQRYQLGNGLTVLVIPDHSAPVVTYQTWFRVGSRDEKPGKTGLAHLFEHLMFNETKSRPHGEFDRLLEEAGAECNAATWTDWTYYYENAPSRSLELLVDLESDRMANLVLRKPNVESEKEVVANERRQRVEDDISGLAIERLYATAFRKHPYRWPTIGWMADIHGFTVNDCRTFYRTFYAPNNAVVVVAGDVKPGELLEMVQRHYGGLRPAKRPQKRFPKEPPLRRERTEVLESSSPTEKLLFGYRIPAFDSKDIAPLTVANELLFGGKSSRLHRRLVEDKELTTDLRGSIAPFRDPSLYEMWFSLREGKTIADVVSAVEAELALLASKRTKAAEIEKAKNQLELSFLHAMETAEGKAEQVGFYEVVGGDATAIFDRLQQYQSVTADDVRRVAARYLRPARRVRVEVRRAA